MSAMYKVISLKKPNFKNISQADIVEIYFDKIPSGIKKPIIYKTKKIPNLNTVKKCQYVDVDIKTSKTIIKKIRESNPKIKIIISYHNFKKTPETKELKNLYKKMKEKGADIVKFATKANTIADSFGMLEFLSSLTQKKQKAICLCMGKKGLLTRISGQFFGNYLMYFTKDGDSTTAPGQITIKEFNALNYES